MARNIEELDFDPEAPTVVLARMDLLAVACDGWVNLAPHVEGGSEEGPVITRLGFSAVLGGPPPPRVPLCTWMPSADRDAPSTVGILHGRGRRAVDFLHSAGVETPPGWRVVQDHQRRGLLYRVPAGTEHSVLLGWTCLAGSRLSLAPLSGPWRAVVHLPRPPRR
jgi:hypothetical protein